MMVALVDQQYHQQLHKYMVCKTKQDKHHNSLKASKNLQFKNVSHPTLLEIIHTE